MRHGWLDLSQASRRIQNQGISKGFTAWQEQYLQAARHKRMLAAASGRLTRPKVAASLSHWRGDWEAARRKALAAGAQRRERERLGLAAEQQVEAAPPVDRKKRQRLWSVLEQQRRRRVS